MTSVSGSVISTTYTYDLNGNQTAGLGRTITWTSYNQPETITQGAHSASFLHDMDHQRFKQVASDGTTLYVRAFGVLAELNAPGTSGARWADYLAVGNVKAGVRFTEVVAQTVTTRYYHTDHLGSIAVITDEAGAVVERLSFDAWGKRRYPNGADDPAGAIESLTTRGFTGHETLDSVGLVHMNGRVYDPLLARMISADPTIPDALNAQAWNRYSYVGNDPLTFTDPSGFGWWSDFWSGVTNFVKSVLKNPIVRAIATIVLAAALPVIGVAVGIAVTAATPFIAAAAASAIVTGLSGGNLGQMLKAGAIAGLTAYAFNVVGTETLGVAHASPFEGGQLVNPGGYAANIAGHAGVGCLSAAASGGNCGEGALSAAVGAAAGPLVGTVFKDPKHNVGDFIGGTAATAAIGGLASVAGGGKFENGAVTAAFGYMYNNLGGSSRSRVGNTGGQRWIGPQGAQTACGPCFLLLGAGIVLSGANGVQSTFDLLTRNKGDYIVNSESGESVGAYGPDGKFTPDAEAAVDLAKQAKQSGGVSPEQAKTLVDWGKEVGFGNRARGPENHGGSLGDHIHVGPVGHIPVR